MKRASKQIFSFVFLLLCVSIVHCIIYAQAHTELNLDSGSHSSSLSSYLIESSGTMKGVPVSSFSTERSSGFLSSTDLISNGWSSVAAFDLASYFFFDDAGFWVGFKPSVLAVLMSFLCLCIRFLESWTHSRR